MPAAFTKSDPHAPPGFFATETAGLRWLAAAGGARVVAVREYSAHALVLDRIDETAPSRDAAMELGRSLARMHAAGAGAFGALPPGAPGYFFGPMAHPLVLPHAPSPHFGEFYAAARVEPMAARCRDAGAIDGVLADAVTRVCTDLRAGRWDAIGSGPVRPARIHGDLWAGNVLWDDGGAVLIDPAACGGHPEADLAMLGLFGAPHLGAVLEGYGQVTPLAEDRADRIGLHRLFPLLVHALLFGGGYAASVREAVAELV